jgi:transposase-like protein
LLKRGGKVFVNVESSCTREELLTIIEEKILEGSRIHTDVWKAYYGLVLNEYEHYRVYDSKDEFARGKNHINGIGSFWSYAERRLSKFNGLDSNNFILHLKKTQNRYNNQIKDLYKLLYNLYKIYLKNKEIK